MFIFRSSMSEVEKMDQTAAQKEGNLFKLYNIINLLITICIVKINYVSCLFNYSIYIPFTIHNVLIYCMYASIMLIYVYSPDYDLLQLHFII